MEIDKLFKSGELKKRCSEAIRCKCLTCGDSFTYEEWTETSGCQTCGGDTYSSNCNLCGGIFDKFPTGNTHTCKSVEQFLKSGQVAFAKIPDRKDEKLPTPPRRPPAPPVVKPRPEPEPIEEPEADPDWDPLYEEAVEIVLKNRSASISLVQRNLRIGYNLAARLVERMERNGIVSPKAENGNRVVLVGGPEKEPAAPRSDSIDKGEVSSVVKSTSVSDKMIASVFLVAYVVIFSLTIGFEFWLWMFGITVVVFIANRLFRAKGVYENIGESFGMSMILTPVLLGVIWLNGVASDYLENRKPVVVEEISPVEPVAAVEVSVDKLLDLFTNDINQKDWGAANVGLNAAYQNYFNNITKFQALDARLIKSSLILANSYLDQSNNAEAHSVLKLAKNILSQNEKEISVQARALESQVYALLSNVSLVQADYKSAIDYGEFSVSGKQWATDEETMNALDMAARSTAYGYFLAGRFYDFKNAFDNADMNSLSEENKVEINFLLLVSRSLLDDSSMHKHVSKFMNDVVDYNKVEIAVVKIKKTIRGSDGYQKLNQHVDIVFALARAS